jgi:hypothetical protein
MSKSQKKPSALKRGHPTLQNMKFYKFFLLLWVIFALLDLDPIRIRIRNPGTFYLILIPNLGKNNSVADPDPVTL